MAKNVDITDFVDFAKVIRDKVSNEPKLNKQNIKDITKKAAGDIELLEKMIAKNVAMSGMEALREEGVFFEITDTKNEASNSKMPPSIKLKTATMAYTGNWNMNIFTDMGRYGLFVEKYLFEGGAGNEAKPDIQLDNGVEIELKSMLHKYGEAITGELTAGKMAKDVTEAFEQIKDPTQQSEFLKGLVYYKYTTKMKNLLIAGVSRLPDNIKWIPTKDGWEEAITKLFFDKLIYFYHLILEYLVQLVEQSIDVKVDVISSMPGSKQTIGSMIKVIKKNDKQIEKFEIKLKVKNLPDIKSFRDEVVENADKLYVGKKVLFDANKDMKEASLFFDRILKDIGK